MFPVKRVVPWVLAFFCALALAKGSYDLLRIILLEAQGPVHDDYLAYTIVGRGLLNGLVPYRDLFECKPPGMFFLTALSLSFTGGSGFSSAFQIFILLALPAVVLAFALRALRADHRVRPDAETIIAVAVPVLMTVLLMLYLERRSGAAQTESFGAFFGCLYALSIAGDDGKFSWGKTLLRAAPLGLSVGFKEPFILTALASAVLLAPHPKALLRTFVLPFLLAAAAGMLLLLVFGQLRPYLTVYLPTMLGYRIAGTEPLWLRAFSVRRILADTTVFHPEAPFLGVLLGALLVAVPLLKGKTAAVSALAVTALGLLSLHGMYVVMTVGRALLAGMGPGNLPGYVRWNLLLAAAVIPAASMLLFRTYRTRSPSFFPALAAPAALFLVSLAVGAGDTYTNTHFGFAVPAFFALVLLFASFRPVENAGRGVAAAAVALTLLAAAFYRPDPAYTRMLSSWTSDVSEEKRAIAAKADALLDACGIARYLPLGTGRDLAFTVHSPAGPLQAAFPQPYLEDAHPLVQRTKEGIEGAAVIFTRNGYSMDRSFASWIGEHFTTDAPPCARAFLPLGDGIITLFRR